MCRSHPHSGIPKHDLSVNLRGDFTGKTGFLASPKNLVKMSLLPTCSSDSACAQENFSGHRVCYWPMALGVTLGCGDLLRAPEGHA